ncbi:MAG: type II toxin-antitoxin system HicB family antitoxin [Phycisphaerales bacterium]
MRHVLLIPDAEGGFVATIPSLPGCISQGDTREEALANIADAADLWLDTAAELGEVGHG